MTRHAHRQDDNAYARFTRGPGGNLPDQKAVPGQGTSRAHAVATHRAKTRMIENEIPRSACVLPRSAWLTTPIRQFVNNRTATRCGMPALNPSAQHKGAATILTPSAPGPTRPVWMSCALPGRGPTTGDEPASLVACWRRRAAPRHSGPSATSQPLLCNSSTLLSSSSTTAARARSPLALRKRTRS